MRASHLLHPDEGQVDITLEGGVTVSELAAHIPLVWSGLDWNPDFNGVLDCSAASLAMFRKVDQVADINSTLRIFFDRRSAEEWLLKVRQPGDRP